MQTLKGYNCWRWNQYTWTQKFSGFTQGVKGCDTFQFTGLWSTDLNSSNSIYHFSSYSQATTTTTVTLNHITLIHFTLYLNSCPSLIFLTTSVSWNLSRHLCVIIGMCFSSFLCYIYIEIYISSLLSVSLTQKHHFVVAVLFYAL